MKDVILLRGVSVDLHQEQIEPTPVYNDNQSAITLSTMYSGAHKRVRYMLTRINWLMEKTKEKVYELLYLSSPELPADWGEAPEGTGRCHGPLSGVQQKMEAAMAEGTLLSLVLYFCFLLL